MLGGIQVGKKELRTIIFNAVRSNNPGCSNTVYLCQKGVITFTTIRINEGLGLLDNGTFIAPSDGIYHIEVSVIAYQNAQLVMKTTRSNQIFHMYDRIYQSAFERTVTKTATLKMEKGDGIYVENKSTDSNAIRADTTYPLIFKGFKIN